LAASNASAAQQARRNPRGSFLMKVFEYRLKAEYNFDECGKGVSAMDLRIILCILVIPAACVPPLSRVARAQSSDGSTSIVSRINASCYNLRRQGVQDFDCVVSGSMIADKFLLTVKADNSFAFDFPSQVPEETQQELRELAANVLLLWRSFVLEPVLLEKRTYGIVKTADGYIVNFLDERGEDNTVHADNDLAITQWQTYSAANGITKCALLFLKTDHGLLPKTCDVTLSRPAMKWSASFDYADTEGLKLIASGR
jgi:hypothetical protein